MLTTNERFHKSRAGKVNASECHICFTDGGKESKKLTKGQITYAEKLAIQSYFQHYDEVQSWRFEHGHMAEPFGIEHLNNHFKNNVVAIPQNDYQWNDEFQYGGGGDAIDEYSGLGLSDDSGYDIKAPTSILKWSSYITSGISKQQYHQCQMYIELYKKKRWYIAAYLKENVWMVKREETYPVPEHQRMVLIKVEREEGWKEKLEAITPKIIAQRDIFYNTLKEQFDHETDTTRQ
jgi:hypothetical protein